MGKLDIQVDLSLLESPSRWKSSSATGIVPEPQGTLSWQSTQSPCEALNALIREAACTSPPYSKSSASGSRTRASSPISSPSHSPASCSFEGDSLSSSTSSNPSLTFISQKRRTRPTSSKELNPTYEATVFQRSRSIETDAAPLRDLFRTVSTKIDQNAKVKKDWLEKEKHKHRKLERRGSAPMVFSSNKTSRPPREKVNGSHSVLGVVTQENIPRAASIDRRRSSSSQSILMSHTGTSLQFDELPHNKPITEMENGRQFVKEPSLPEGSLAEHRPMLPPPPPASLRHPPSTCEPSYLHNSSSPPSAPKRDTLELRRTSNPPIADAVNQPTAQCHNTYSPEPYSFTNAITRPGNGVPVSAPLPLSSQSGANRASLPALGMRRSPAYGSSTHQTGLPTKQRGFKSPFARPQPVTEESNPTTSPAAYPPPTPPLHLEGKPVVTTSNDSDAAMTPSSPELDADSSFGDIDLPMDLSAIEEEMRKYEC